MSAPDNKRRPHRLAQGVYGFPGDDLDAHSAIKFLQTRVPGDRAVALEQARQVAVQERAREVRRRFQGGGTPYTPYAVNYY